MFEWHLDKNSLNENEIPVKKETKENGALDTPVMFWFLFSFLKIINEYN